MRVQQSTKPILVILAAISASTIGCNSTPPTLRAQQASDAQAPPSSRNTFVRTDDGDFQQTGGAPDGTDAAFMSRARTLILDGEHDTARKLLTEWLEEREDLKPTDVPYRDEALLARGDARVADNDEFLALYDYEKLLREHPSSPLFARAVERELEIAKRYARGLKRKAWGIRIFDSNDVAEELFIRVQERVPGSALAEEAAIELADYFFRNARIKLASEAYQLYLENFPEGPNARKANERLIFSNVARFKGPRYDGSVLLDAQVLIRRFAQRYPIDAARSGINEGLIARLDESLAAKMLDSAQWYDRTGEPESARLTLNRLHRTYPTTVSGRTAKRMLDDRGWLATSSADELDDDTRDLEIEGPADAEQVEEGS